MYLNLVVIAVLMLLLVLLVAIIVCLTKSVQQRRKDRREQWKNIAYVDTCVVNETKQKTCDDYAAFDSGYGDFDLNDCGSGFDGGDCGDCGGN